MLPDALTVAGGLDLQSSLLRCSNKWENYTTLFRPHSKTRGDRLLGINSPAGSAGARPRGLNSPVGCPDRCGRQQPLLQPLQGHSRIGWKGAGAQRFVRLRFMPDDSIPQDSAPARVGFSTTHWSVVHRAALGELCSAYWYPLYGFVRRHGFSQHNAQDCTRGFDRRQNAGPGRRGSGAFPLISAWSDAEPSGERKAPARRSGADSRSSFRSMTCRVKVVTRLNRQTGSRPRPSSSEAGHLRCSNASLSASRRTMTKRGERRCSPRSNRISPVAIHRMRRRYDEFPRDEIAQPVAPPEEDEAEFAYLLQVVARG